MEIKIYESVDTIAVCFGNEIHVFYNSGVIFQRIYYKEKIDKDTFNKYITYYTTSEDVKKDNELMNTENSIYESLQNMNPELHAEEFLKHIFNGLKDSEKVEHSEYLERIQYDSDYIEIYTVIERSAKELEESDKESKIKRITNNLTKCLQPTKTKKELYDYIHDEYRLIRRKETNNYYILDNVGYKKVSIHDLKEILGSDLGYGLLPDNFLEDTLLRCDDFKKPQYNIIKFNNCMFDIENMEVIETEEPIFTLIETEFNYNPEAESTIIKDYLYSSLERDTKEETEKAIKSVLEVIGYLFTSGNKKNAFPIITGIGGSGKSVLGNILTIIFGVDNVSNMGIQEAISNTHATASLVDKTINIIGEADSRTIENSTLIKNLTGNDKISVNPKYQNPFTIPAEEVPKTIMICNSIPSFKENTQALEQRLVIIEFPHKIRGTPKENPNLINEIKNNPEEVEWLIAESIKAYNEMDIKGADFIARSETQEKLFKNTNPINWIIRKLILKHDPYVLDENYSTVEERKAYTPVFIKDLKRIVLLCAEECGLDIKLDKRGEVSAKTLNTVIKEEFEIYENVIQHKIDTFEDVTSGHRDKYASLNWNNERYYPDLFVTDKYKEYLEKIENVPYKNSYS